jgi:3-hydroxyacyl-[acyl-carrier-protein] dehydratase
MASGVIDSGLDPEILNQVRTLLRRDIKLPADDPLPAEQRLFGGVIDLDSLDMLLLITSIEKQFKVRIADRAAGEEAFQSVGSLARFVQQHRGNGTAANKSDKPTPAIDWLAQLPHGKAFRFVSSIIEVRSGESARGIWNLDGSEPFFAGHFPGNPIVPGVLIVEALAQISGLAGAANSGRQGKLAHVDVRFEQTVAPPAEIELDSKIVSVLEALQRCDVIAKVGTNVVAQGTITLHRGDGAKT